MSGVSDEVFAVGARAITSNWMSLTTPLDYATAAITAAHPYLTADVVKAERERTLRDAITELDTICHGNYSPDNCETCRANEALRRLLARQDTP